jgi:hypothetical protein
MTAAHNDDGMHFKETCIHCLLTELRAELELAKKFHTDEYKNRLELTAKAESLELQVEVMRKALEKIRDHEGPGLDGSPATILYDVAVSALAPVAEKQKCDGTEVRLDPSRGVFVCQKCSEIHESK